MTTLDRTSAHPPNDAVNHGAADPAADVITNVARGSSNASFAGRHIGPTAEDEQIMLRELGYSDLDTLIAAAVPSAVRSTTELALPPAVSEATALGELQQSAAANDPGEAMIGLGYHSTVTPPVIRRNVLENSAPAAH